MLKRDRVFKKWNKEPKLAKKNGFTILRNKVTGHTWEAKREHDFKKIGNNPSSKTIHSSLKTHEKKKHRITRGLVIKCSTTFSRNLVQHFLENLKVLVFGTTFHKILDVWFWFTPPRNKARQLFQNWQPNETRALMVSEMRFSNIVPFLIEH